jgi:hypothetical protein
MMNGLSTAWATESQGHSVPRLKVFLEYISQRLAARDFERALDLLHAACSTPFAASLAKADQEAAAAAAVEAVERAQRKSAKERIS